MSIRLMNAPNNYPYTHGWGVYPQLATELGKRRRSAKNMLGFIDGTPGVKPGDWRYSALILEDAFRSVAGESSRDWFTLTNHLGQPSRALAHEIFEHLRTLKELDPRSSEAGRTFDLLEDLALPDMLQYFRETTSAEDPRPVDIREGWCHVLWTHETPDRLLVGAVHGTPVEVVSVLDHRSPGVRHGVLAAWHVEDPDWAASQIVRTFGKSLDQLGLMQLPAAEGIAAIKLLTENAIWKTIAKSPWHVEAGEPPCGEAADTDSQEVSGLSL
ncbi:hypothetical protein ACCS70_19975 [Rhizobium ruizarguesonis]|uniref:hypothetical protein n=1 Tax=Rhizobium ruizarguesonis TaxID=2081791 RepID=UPI001031E139|nr:hypothetical protein [Rhizobium ruizarguesonis]NEH34943.1 hypothetical protein [Rhizobium ruizarguesonis]NEI78767.1 hypothetical protein [Rhizobium ruizarguesonis]TAW77236.1 hypothetical protein ELI10_08455 [Rhizobium ruizarguesonis]TAX14200.1 hypothetical protein ELI09_08515 [Rhizobium ruizarguesonis]TAX19033.1 hypothetical protein ELI08_08515 [Rhizobium ruizarguesonis]